MNRKPLELKDIHAAYLLGDKNINQKHLYLNWESNAGFGQLYFYYDKDGSIHCDNELISHRVIHLIMTRFIDSISFSGNNTKEIKHISDIEIVLTLDSNSQYIMKCFNTSKEKLELFIKNMVDNCILNLDPENII